MLPITIVGNHIEVKQKSPPKKITGTKFAAIFNKNPYKTPFEVWLDVTHTYDFPFESNIYTEAGNTIEPKQAVYANTILPKVLSPSDKFGENYFNKTHGNFFNGEHFGGMWDYLQLDNDNNVISVFEMKTTGISNKKKWDEDIPEHYALQAALYAYLLDVEDVYMVVSFLANGDYQMPYLYTPDKSNTEIHHFKLHERYPSFENDYIEPAIKWWNDYVVTGISPEFDKTNKEHVRLLQELSSQGGAEESVAVFDTNKVDELIDQTHNNVAYFTSVSDEIVSSYCKDLDDMMKELYREVITVDQPDISVLEKYFLRLTNLLYFEGEKLERLGIHDDMSKSAAREVYNKAYIENQSKPMEGNKKPTVGENQAYAESASIYESTVNNIYSRAYKIMKNKIDAGYEMVKTLSKIISRRMSETQLSSPRYDIMNGGKQILNEDIF